MKITINGATVPVKEEKTVLEVCQREGIWVPTLCHHPGLTPYGACRLCVVEIKAGGRPGLIASCALPVADGLVIETDSRRVQERRKVLMQLLLAQTPDSPVIRELAERIGVITTPFEKSHKETADCVLCGLCVRVCQQIGSYAIGFARRGWRRQVMPPFGKPSDSCLGCQACARVCPTGYVRFTLEGDRLKSETWRADLPVVRCSSCHRPFAPQMLQEHLAKEIGPDIRVESICPDCRRKQVARMMAESSLAR